ncbi:hypothetical protein [Candidatus Cardinium hertigii]|nr:hypothetical protein [Candidatus Cardinium hertigii]
MEGGSQTSNQECAITQKYEEKKTHYDCGCNLPFPVLYINNNIILLPCSKFSEILPLMTKEEKEILYSALEDFTTGNLNITRKRFTFNAPDYEKVKEAVKICSRIPSMKKEDNVQTFIEQIRSMMAGENGKKFEKCVEIIKAMANKEKTCNPREYNFDWQGKKNRKKFPRFLGKVGRKVSDCEKEKPKVQSMLNICLMIRSIIEGKISEEEVTKKICLMKGDVATIVEMFSIEDKIDKLLKKTVRSIVGHAIEDQEMTYGEFAWGFDTKRIQFLIQARRSIIQKEGFSFGSAGLAYSQKSEPPCDCKRILDNDTKKKKLHQVMSCIWRRESIFSRMLMNLFMDDNQNKIDNNDSKYRCKKYMHKVPKPIFITLAKALKNQSVEEVTEKYEKLLIDSMNQGVQMEDIEEEDIKKALGVAEPNTSRDDVNALSTRIEETGQKKSNGLPKPINKAKKQIATKSKPLAINRWEEENSEKAIDPPAIDQLQLSNSGVEFEREAIPINLSSLHTKYKLHARVKKWSLPVNTIWDHFQQAPKNSYDWQFKAVNKNPTNLIKEIVKHDLTPIYYLLEREDADKYFYTRRDNNIRTAAVLVKNQNMEKYGMVDIAIGNNNVIYHQSIRFLKKAEETFSAISKNDEGNEVDQADDNAAYQIVPGRCIQKDPITKAYIVHITNKDNQELTKEIHVLRSRIPKSE